MATAGDGRAPYESGGAGEKFRERLFQPDIYEEPQNVSQEAGRSNVTGASELSTQQGGNFASVSVTVGKSELEQMLKQMTFTRSEIQRLIELLQSRITAESPSDIVVVERDGAKLPPPSSPSRAIRLEASTSGSLKKCKHGDERDNFRAAVSSSRVAGLQIASPAELGNACKGGTIGTAQAPRQDSELFYNNATGLPGTLKASPQHPATMDNLPDELLSNIFIRLLAKQLAQMRSVSKSWNALLSQSSFIKSHLHRSTHNSNHLLAFYGEESDIFLTPFTIHSCQSSDLELTNCIKLPVNPQFENSNVVKVIGAVNGLVCYSHSDSVIHIWNPSLSTVLTLPPYSMPSHGYKSIKIFFRFVFDPKTDDYKVVKLTGLIGQSIHVVKWWLQIEIYSMRKGTWELITERFPSHIRYIRDADHVCADGHDGHLHWLGRDEVNLERIVAFDLGTESFCEIPMPDSIQARDWESTLGVLCGKLLVVSFDGYDSFEVWVMDEYGVAESWVKRHVFLELIDFPGVHGFTSHNEFLVADDGYIVLYDPVANKKTYLEKYCLVANKKTYLEKYCFGRGYPDKIVKYVDNLVWVAPPKC